MISVKQFKSLDGYDGVILGSAIRMGSWLPEAKTFVEQHQAELNTIPTAIFTVHLLNLDDSPESQAARATYVAPVCEHFIPVAEVFSLGGWRWRGCRYLSGSSQKP